MAETAKSATACVSKRIPPVENGDNMKYTFDYEYDEKYAHRLIHAGNLYYQYDANGNVTCEQEGQRTNKYTARSETSYFNNWNRLQSFY